MTSDASDVDTVLSIFARKVLLARTAPADMTIDQYHPDLNGLDPAGHRDTTVDALIGSAWFAEEGLPSPVSDSTFFDLFPLSVLSTSTLDRLRELAPDSSIDERRFRMNVIVAATGSGFVENFWVGRQLTVGDVGIDVKRPDPRCVMTTLAQQDLPRDSNVLRTLVQHNKIDVVGEALYPCAGVYPVVSSSGAIQRGDGVTISSCRVDSSTDVGAPPLLVKAEVRRCAVWGRLLGELRSVSRLRSRQTVWGRGWPCRARVAVLSCCAE